MLQKPWTLLTALLVLSVDVLAAGDPPLGAASALDRAVWHGGAASAAKAKQRANELLNAHRGDALLERKLAAIQEHIDARAAGLAPNAADRAGKRAAIDVAASAEFGLECERAIPLDIDQLLRFTAYPDRPTFVRLAAETKVRQVNTFGSEVDTALSQLASCDGELTQYNDDAVGLQAALTIDPDAMLVRVDALSEPGTVVLAVEQVAWVIDGRITSAVDGEGIANQFVRASTSTITIAQTTTNARGAYRLSSTVAPGAPLLVHTAFNAFSSATIYANGIFPRGICLGTGIATCDLTQAEQLPVNPPFPTYTGIDIRLDLAARVNFAVSNTATGLPVLGASVNVVNSDGPRSVSGSLSTNGSGIASFYFAGGSFRASITAPGFISRLHRDRNCEACDINAADLIAIGPSGSFSTEIVRLDQVQRINLRINTVGATGTATVRVFNPTFQRVFFNIPANADTALSPLPAGNYKVVVEMPQHFGVTVDGAECIAPCDPATVGSKLIPSTSGTSQFLFYPRLWPTVRVEIRDRQSGASINQAILRRQGSGGSFTNLGAGNLLFNANPGLMYLHASSDEHADLAFPDISCEIVGSVIDIANNCPQAIPLVTDLTSPPRSIRFELTPHGRVSGTIRVGGGVLSDVTNLRLPSINFITGGALAAVGVGRLQILSLGNYRLTDIPPLERPLGLWGLDFTPEVYNNVSCPVIGGNFGFVACNLPAATVLRFTGNEHLTHIDFSVEPRAAIRGRVVSRDNGLPVVGIRMDARRIVSGRPRIVSTVTDADGRFSLALDSGSGAVVINTAANATWINQVYDNRPCPIGDVDCEQTAALGTPVVPPVDRIEPDQIQIRLDRSNDLIFRSGVD